MNELAWADAIKGEPLLDEMMATTQAAYNHWEGSGKKKLSYKCWCVEYKEKMRELVSMHGIRWREASWRASVNMLLSWRARVSDLYEQAMTEIGLKLTLLSPNADFKGVTFLKKTRDPEYGAGDLIFSLKVVGVAEAGVNGLDMFNAMYMRVINGKRCACKREIEKFNKGDLLSYINADKKNQIAATDAGKLHARLTSYKYVKALSFWIDATAEGKVMSKVLQANGVLLSDVTRSVEDCVEGIDALPSFPGKYMSAFAHEYDAANETLFGHELSDVASGQIEYDHMVKNVTAGIQEDLVKRFSSILKDPVMKAACVFEHSRWPSIETAKGELERFGDDDIQRLLSHYEKLFKELGGDASKVMREWRRLKMRVSKELSDLPYKPLYERLRDHFAVKGNDAHFYNVLLLEVMVSCIAVDTSICERAFALMNNLKTARRSSMGNELLRILMTICSLGGEWNDASKIPVDEIIEEWRTQSKNGRYESAMWSAAGLEEPRVQ